MPLRSLFGYIGDTARASFSSRYSKIIAAALIVRFLLMPFTIQSDIIEQSWITHFVALGHINVYVYYHDLFGTDMFPPTNTPIVVAAGFPPLFYLLYGLYMVLMRSLGIFNFFSSWDFAGIWLFPSQSRVFFMAKAFLIPFDLLGLFAFMKCLEPRQRSLGVFAWAFNPIILYVTYAWGQTDIMAASLMMVSLLFARRCIGKGNFRDGILSCLALGLSASFKLYSLALFPVFGLFFSKHTKRSLAYFLLAGVSPLSTMIPFVSKPFLQAMFSYSGYLLSRNSPAPYPQYTFYAAFAVYVAVIYYLYFVGVDRSFDSLLVYSLVVFALLYALGLWLPNWILWILPLLLLAVFRRPRLFSLYLLVIVLYFVFVQAWGNELWIGLFCPLTYSGPCIANITGTFGTFPALRDIFPFIGGQSSIYLASALAYTAIGVSLFFVPFYLLRVSNRPIEIPGYRHWFLAAVIPIVFGGLTLVAGQNHIQDWGLPIIPTLAQRIMDDPYFFSLYGLLICFVALWLICLELNSRRKLSLRLRSPSD